MNDNEKKKIFMMRVIIGSVVFIILILWGFNLKNVWRDSQGRDKASAQWLSLKSDLEKSLGEAQARLNQIEADKAIQEKQAGADFLSDLKAEAEKKAAASLLASSTSPDIATSSPIYSTPDNSETASTTKLNKNCPPYIDCMPTIGQAKPCIVPPGCEGITTIAY